MLKEKRGITLISLIVTIIVLLILVGISITSIVSDNGIINKTQKANELTDIGSDKELIKISLSEWQVREDEKDMLDFFNDVNLFKSVTDCGSVLKITMKDCEHKYMLKKNNGDVEKIEVKIPINGKYVKNDGTELLEGEYFPDIPEKGDKYFFEDYEYRYNQYYNTGSSSMWSDNELQNGWGVRVLDTTQTEYEQILTNIMGYPITNLNYTFYNCKQLVDASTIIINEGVVDLTCAFANCSKLEKIAYVPSSVTIMRSTFFDCYLMKEAPVISENVIDIGYIYHGCSSLTGKVVINSNPIVYNGCFYKVNMDSIELTGKSDMLELLEKQTNWG